MLIYCSFTKTGPQNLLHLPIYDVAGSSYILQEADDIKGYPLHLRMLNDHLTFKIGIEMKSR